jgi:hypothetical protein
MMPALQRVAARLLGNGGPTPISRVEFTQLCAACRQRGRPQRKVVA